MCSVLYCILRNCKSDSDYLQTEDLDLGAASIAVADLTTQLNVMRSNEECRKLYDKVLAQISEIGQIGIFKDLSRDCNSGVANLTKHSRNSITQLNYSVITYNWPTS